MFKANRYIRIGTMNFSIIMCSVPQDSPVTEGGVHLGHTLYLSPSVVIHFSGGGRGGRIPSENDTLHF